MKKTDKWPVIMTSLVALAVAQKTWASTEIAFQADESDISKGVQTTLPPWHPEFTGDVDTTSPASGKNAPNKRKTSETLLDSPPKEGEPIQDTPVKKRPRRKIAEQFYVPGAYQKLEEEIEANQSKRGELALQYIKALEEDLIPKQQKKQPKKKLSDDDDNADDDASSDSEIDDLQELRDGVKALKPLPDIYKRTKKMLHSIENSDPASETNQIRRTQLETIISLPWIQKPSAKDTRSPRQILIDVQKTLDEDHFGLEEPKKHIIDFMAKQLRTGKAQGKILCFVGPPGVGKTSLAMSIAKALNRPFVNVSLGGIHDAASIHGSRPVYIGASSGDILKAIQRAKDSKAVVLLDEIDKLGKESMNGNPESALLPLLDSVQNNDFQDLFIDPLKFNFSETFFIATANTLDKLSKPLANRLDVIELSSYTPMEKLAIAKRYLVPKNITGHKIAQGELSFTDETLERIISVYTYESGVRELARVIGKICNRVVTENTLSAPRSEVILPNMLETYLGPSQVIPEAPLEVDTVGHNQGLAVTDVGGVMCPMGVQLTSGSGKIECTGNLQTVMKESIQVAFTLVKTLLPDLGQPAGALNGQDVHVHFYEGSIERDGPSAGIAITTAIASAVSGFPVRRDICMTGEVNLHGQVLRIGGLKEKLIAAHRAHMRIALIPKQNESMLTKVPDEVKRGLRIIPVDNILEVLRYSLRRPKGDS